MKNKKEVIERIENMTKEKDFSFYIFTSDKGVSINANKPELCTLVTSLLQYCKKKDMINDRDIDRICILAKKNENELEKELLKELTKLASNKGSKSAEAIIDMIIKDLEEM